MFVRQGANCSLLVSDQVAVGLKEIFLNIQLGQQDTVQRQAAAAAKETQTKPLNRSQHQKMPIPLQKKKALSWFSLFLL